MAPSKKVCLVTHELQGCGQNGDHGYQTRILALLYAQQPEWQVTVLFVGRTDEAQWASVSADFEQQGVQCEKLNTRDLPTYPRPAMVLEHLCSDAIYLQLRGREFSKIVFFDTLGLSYVCCQAKTVGLAFMTTQLVVVLMGSAPEADAGLPGDLITSVIMVKHKFMRKFCLHHADLLIAPCQAVMDEATVSGAPKHRITRLGGLLTAAHWHKPASRSATVGHLVFFGDLSARHGFFSFLKALGEQPKFCVRQITLLTRLHLSEKQKNDPELKALLRKVGLKGGRLSVQLYRDLDDAAAFLQQSGALAVFAQMGGNAPMALLMCLAHGLPCMVSNRGGLGELVEGDATFDPQDSVAFAQVLAPFPHIERPVQHHYDRKAVEKEWLDLLVEETQNTSAEVHDSISWPSVAVCVPYYNGAEFLADTLASLARSEYPSLEVIVIDDGSTDAEAVRVFAEMQNLYAPRGWRFLRQKNGGVGRARNAAAGMTQAEFLVFFDADDLAVPSMLKDFVRGAVCSGADAVSCYYAAFMTEKWRRGETGFAFGYVPMGACLGGGALENLFGGANFCVKRTTFWELGGFTAEHGGCEDWEFFARLTLSGKRLQVIPKTLFFYRLSSASMCTTMDRDGSHARALRSYAIARPEQIQQVFKDAMIPLYQENKLLLRSHEAMAQRVRRLEAKIVEDKGGLHGMQTEPLPVGCTSTPGPAAVRPVPEHQPRP